MKRFLWNKDIGYWILGITLFFVFAKTVHAQEVVEIPGPEIKEAGFIQVKDLNLGDVVFVKNEAGELMPATITKLEYQQEPVEVYNLTVEGEETFFANDFAVHNKGGDETKPVCRVIINPEISDHINGSVVNRSFEVGAAGTCPPFRWLECISGSPVVRSGTVPWCGNPCGNKSVRVSWPNASVWQNVLSSYVKTGSRYLYKITAYGRGTSPTIQFGSEDFFQRKCSATIYDPSGGWAKRSLLAWARGSGDQILKLYIEKANEDNWADFDLVEFQELQGLADKATVNDLDVNLYVAYSDDHIVTRLRHWNEGEPVPAWDSGIWFGLNVNSSADPIAHTLRTGGGDEKTVNVQIRDFGGNISDTCSWTVTYVQPTGTITGNVYEDLSGGCEGTTPVVDPNWSVTCQGGDMVNPVPADIDVNIGKFTCCKDWVSGCNDQLPYDPTDGTPYNISVTPPADYKMTSCSGQGTESWTTSSGKIIATVNLDRATKSPKDLYLWKGASAWFQTQGGDVHSIGNIESLIPDTATEKNFSVLLDNYPGLISYGGDSNPSFGEGNVSAEDFRWLASDDLTLTYDYDNVYSKFGSPNQDNFNGDLREIIVGITDGVYYSGDDVTINNKWNFPGSTKATIFINGNLEIDKDIDVPVGSFLAFIVKGNINIHGQLGDKLPTVLDGDTAHLQGVYIASKKDDGTSGTIYTFSDNNPEDPNNGLRSGFRLVAAGIFYAEGGFSLGRDLKNDCLTTPICNETTPAELFIARPDLFINIPEELKTSYFFEQEVAP